MNKKRPRTIRRMKEKEISQEEVDKMLVACRHSLPIFTQT